MSRGEHRRPPSALPRTQAGSTLLKRLTQAIDQFPGALARAARYVVENPEKVVYQSLAEFSEYSGAGQASIVRLCRELDFDGFTDFKLALFADLALQGEKRPTAEMPLDALSGVADLLCASIVETRAHMDPAQLAGVARRIAASVRIDLFGAGVSGIVAELLAYRLLRLGLHANAMRDAVLAHEVSNGLKAGATAIAVSQSGSTRDTVRFLKCARDVGAFAVAITCHRRSPLARVADETLIMARLQRPIYGGPIADVPRAIMIAEALAIELEPLVVQS